MLGDELNDPEEHSMRGLLRAAMGLIFEPILNLIQRDPHMWSSRPCQSCRTVSSIIGRPFGCYLYQQERQGQKGD